MKRFAHTLASALSRRARWIAPARSPIATSADGDLPAAYRRSEAFAEDLGDLVSRRPAVLHKRDLRTLP
jgi:hypothetical protein